MGNNQRLFLINYLLLVLSGGLCAEGYLQSFLLAGGMDVEGIGLYGVSINAAMLIAYAVFPMLRPRGDSHMKMMIFTGFGIILYPAGLLALSFTGLQTGVARGAVLAVGMGYAFLSAVRASSEFSVIPMLFPRRDYGALMGKGGMLGGALATLISLLGAYLLRQADAMNGYRLFFALAAALFALAALAPTRYRPGSGGVESEGERRLGAGLLRLLLTKRYAKILLPHFLRGIGMAAMYYFVIVALREMTLNASESAGLVTVGVLSGMLGNYLFMRYIGKMRSGQLVLISNIVCAACMLLVAPGLNKAMFFAVYFVYGMANIISQTGVPVGVLRSTPTEELPLISSVRMFVCSGASCVFIPLFGALLADGLDLIIMVVGGAFFVVAGVLFFWQYQDELT